MTDNDYKKYVKKELHEKFKQLCENNSLDFYSCGCILTAHLVLRRLMQHKYKDIWKEAKCTPKEAWDEAMKQTDYHSRNSASMTASIVSSYSLRGEEFQVWWNKKQGGTGEEEGTINPTVMTIGPVKKKKWIAQIVK